MKPWFFAAGIETLITLLIFVGLSVLSSWLKNRNAEKEADDLPPPPRIPRRGQPDRPAQPAREQKPVSWEEELRRLLEGESPAAPPPQPILVERRAPEPPPLPPITQTPLIRTANRRSVVAEEESAEGGGRAVNMPTLSQAASSQAYASQVDDRAAERLRQGGAFAAANASFARASQLHELTAARMRHVSEQTPAMMAVTTRVSRTSEGVRVSAMLRNPESVRTAIVASIILGQPKAIES
jgi:hypothetical protein